MKKIFLIFLFSANTFAGEWIADSKNGCQVWNPNPKAGESIEWSGGCKNGKPSGKGILKWYKDGKADSVLEGEFVNGDLNGQGKSTSTNGGSYEGNFKEGQPHGQGKMIFTGGNDYYEGGFKDGKRNGKGKYVAADGSGYEGYWIDGLKEGKGKYSFADGSSYEGNWKKNLKDGKGKFINAEGGSYEGDWKNDLKDGKGKEHNNDGSGYAGDWKDNKADGIGKIIYSDGSRYEGSFKSNSKEGKGIYISPKGSKYEGEFKNNLKDGFAVLSIVRDDPEYNLKKFGYGIWRGEQHIVHIYFKAGHPLFAGVSRSEIEGLKNSADVKNKEVEERNLKIISKIPFLIMDQTDIESAKKALVLNGNSNGCKPFNKYIYTKYGTAIDPRTGLEWTRCMLGQSWDGTACRGNAIASSVGLTKEEMMSAPNVMKFTGSTNWRLPTNGEISTTFYESESKACQDDSNYIPPFFYSMSSDNVVPARFFLQPTRTFGMSVDNFDSYGFQNGTSKYKKHLICEGDYCTRRFDYDLNGAGWIFVRMASTSKPVAQSGEQEFVDPATSLIWRRCPIGMDVSQANGKEVCVGSDKNQFTLVDALSVISKKYPDWRLPTLAEVNYLLARSGQLESIPYSWGGYHSKVDCERMSGVTQKLFPKAVTDNSKYVSGNYILTADYISDAKIPIKNIYLDDPSTLGCKIGEFAYSNAERPILLVKGYDSSGLWDDLIAKKLTSFKLNAAANQARQQDNLKFESSWMGQFIKNMREDSASLPSSNESPSRKWKVISSKKGNGGTDASTNHWFTEEYRIECTSSDKRGLAVTIQHLNSGVWEAVNGIKDNSLEAVADYECRN